MFVSQVAGRLGWRSLAILYGGESSGDCPLLAPSGHCAALRATALWASFAASI